MGTFGGERTPWYRRPIERAEWVARDLGALQEYQEREKEAALQQALRDHREQQFREQAHEILPPEHVMSEGRLRPRHVMVQGEIRPMGPPGNELGRPQGGFPLGPEIIPDRVAETIAQWKQIKAERARQQQPINPAPGTRDWMR